MSIIGITLEKEAFRVAILKREKNKIAVETLQTFPFGPDNVKLFYNLPPFHAGKEARIASGLSGTGTFVRKLHLPLKERSKLLAALPFQLEGLIPFSTEEAIICPLLRPISKQMTSVTVFATLKETLSSHLAELKELDIEPHAVSCAPAALARFAQWQFPTENKILSFDIREKKILCVLSEGYEIVLSQTLFMNEDVSIELDKLHVFLKQKGAIEEGTPWLLSGDPIYSDTIAKVFRGAQLKIEKALSDYTLAIGLALDALAEDEYSVQFCQKEFTPARLLQSRKKKILSYVGICLIAAVLTVASGSFMLKKKQDLIAEKLQGYLAPALSKGPLSSREEIQNKLLEWEKSLAAKKTPFALIPTVPKVSDVLAWLSTHPSFATEDGGKKEGMEFKSLHYRLIKYPKIGEGSSAYVGQVDLEFSSATPRTARDFHEALIKGDQIVNAKKEIKWQTQNQTYHTSFELNRGAL